MHEMSVAMSIVESVSDAVLSGEPRQTVSAVYVRVGAMSGVIPEALAFAWDAATGGTRLDGSRLEIEAVPTAVYCPQCQADRELPGQRLRCPVCHTRTPQVVRGRELDILSVEIHDEQPVPD